MMQCNTIVIGDKQYEFAGFGYASKGDSFLDGDRVATMGPDPAPNHPVAKLRLVKPKSPFAGDGKAYNKGRSGFGRDEFGLVDHGNDGALLLVVPADDENTYSNNEPGHTACHMFPNAQRVALVWLPIAELLRDLQAHVEATA
jgi:hypothetical protein